MKVYLEDLDGSRSLREIVFEADRLTPELAIPTPQGGKLIYGRASTAPDGKEIYRFRNAEPAPK